MHSQFLSITLGCSHFDYPLFYGPRGETSLYTHEWTYKDMHAIQSGGQCWEDQVSDH